MEWTGDPQVWAALLTLTAIEIVLGVDNVIAISILANRLPPHHQTQARYLGLTLALLARLALLASIVWVAKLTASMFEAFGRAFSWRDVILVTGGLFLVYSGTREIHGHIEGHEPSRGPRSVSTSFARIVTQMVLLDMVFSLDSIITAVGMANEFWVMAVAIVIAVAVMLAAATTVATFISRRPTVKVLVLSFLLLIGMVLITDGFGFHVPRTYIYVAIGFSIGVEVLNQLAARRRRANLRAETQQSTVRHTQPGTRHGEAAPPFAHMPLPLTRASELIQVAGGTISPSPRKMRELFHEHL
jgi:predicted tellurium resistance membrane protein TerC